MKENNNLKEYFKENIKEITKRIIELLEFQENIKFINTTIYKKEENTEYKSH